MDRIIRHKDFNVIIVLFAVIIGLFIVIGSFSFRYGMMGGMMGIGWFFMMLPIFIIIVFIVAISDRDNISFQTPDRPKQILDQRYARGEISRDEYFRIKNDLYRNNSL